jgi:hypothetical protein
MASHKKHRMSSKNRAKLSRLAKMRPRRKDGKFKKASKKTRKGSRKSRSRSRK